MLPWLQPPKTIKSESRKGSKDVKKRVAKKIRKLERAVGLKAAGRLIVFDLEATCWEPEEPERIEILEIGAVAMQSGTATPEFSEVVRPGLTADLGPFCLGLIPIAQEEAEAADPFPAVFARFTAWAGRGPFWLAAWGNFDRKQLETECTRHGLRLPANLVGFLDMRREFGRWKHVRPPGLEAAMATCGLAIEGRRHRALDDARNLARLARILVDETHAAIPATRIKRAGSGDNDAHGGTDSAVQEGWIFAGRQGPER